SAASSGISAARSTTPTPTADRSAPCTASRWGSGSDAARPRLARARAARGDPTWLRRHVRAADRAPEADRPHRPELRDALDVEGHGRRAGPDHHAGPGQPAVRAVQPRRQRAVVGAARRGEALPAHEPEPDRLAVLR